jgi:hypothetical protein
MSYDASRQDFSVPLAGNVEKIWIDRKKPQKSGTDDRIFKNIFAEKFSEKIGGFDSKRS